jgi:predicted RNase H-like HicB family nuclease
MISKRRSVLGTVLVDVVQYADGTWHGTIEGFHDLQAAGATEDEVVRETQCAAVGYLIDCQLHGKPMPPSIAWSASPYAEWPDW